MPRGSKSINRPPTPEPEDQSRELSLEEDIRLRVGVHAQWPGLPVFSLLLQL